MVTRSSRQHHGSVSRADLVVYVASTPYDGPAGTDRHIADRLSAHTPVLYVNPPTSWRPGAARRRGAVRTGARPPGLHVLDPVLPPGAHRPVVHRTIAPLVRGSVRRAVRRLSPTEDRRVPVRGLVTCSVEPVWRAVPARRTVYFATDDLVAGADLIGLPESRLRRKQARLLREVDVVAAVSPTLADTLAAAGRRAAVVPNGCDPDAFAHLADRPRPADVPRDRPIAGFVGFINDRIDLELLESVADAGVGLLLVGPVAHGYDTARFEELVGRAGVHWAGAKDYTDLPAYVATMDVGLTPYADTAFNRASFPLKTLEYLSAGLPVVATPLPAYEWLATDLIDTAAGAAPYAGRVLEVLARAPGAGEPARRRAFARRHSWAARAETLLALIDAGPTTEEST